MDLTANDCAELSGVSVRAINAWKYLYHAVDKEGKTIDFLLTARRNKEAAQCLFDKAMKATCISEKATMDKSGANKVSVNEINTGREMSILVRQLKYFNNLTKRTQGCWRRCVLDPSIDFPRTQVITLQSRGSL